MAQERAHPSLWCPRPTCHPQARSHCCLLPPPPGLLGSWAPTAPRGDGPGPWGRAPVPAMGRSAGALRPCPQPHCGGQGGAGLSWALGSCPDSGSGVPSPWPHPAAAHWSPSSGGGGPGGRGGRCCKPEGHVHQGAHCVSARVGCYLGPDPAAQPRGAPPGSWCSVEHPRHHHLLQEAGGSEYGAFRDEPGKSWGRPEAMQLSSSPLSRHFLGSGKWPEVGNQPGHFF